MKRLALAVLLLFAPSAWGASLPLPSIACDTGGGTTTGTCDAKPEDASTSPWTMTRPTHAVEGDLLFASCTVDTAATTTFVGGATWNQFGTDNGNIDGLRLTAWQKILGASEPASYTLSGTGGTNSFAACAMSAWRSIAQTSQYESNVVETTGTGTSATCGSITTSANALAICYCGALNDPTYTPPSGYTEEIDEAGTMHAGKVWTAGGATGDQTATLSTSQEWVCRHMSFAYNATGTRLPLPSSGAPSVTPNFGSVWEKTTDATRIAATFTKGSTAMTTVTGNEAAGDTTAKDHLIRQYVVPIGAQTISGVVQCNVRVAESTTALDAHASLYIQLADSAGTLTSEVLLNATGASGVVDEYGTTLAARNFPRKGDAHTLTSQTAANGDHLIIEFGNWHNQTAATVLTYTFRFGDTAATALDRDDTETADNHSWCDFLGGLLPASSGTNPGGGMGRNW